MLACSWSISKQCSALCLWSSILLDLYACFKSVCGMEFVKVKVLVLFTRVATKPHIAVPEGSALPTSLEPALDLC